MLVVALVATYLATSASGATISLASSIAYDTEADLAYAWTSTSTWEGGIVPGVNDDVILGSTACGVTSTSCMLGNPNTGDFPVGPRITISMNFFSSSALQISVAYATHFFPFLCFCAAGAVTVKSLWLNGGYLSVVGTTGSSTLNITNGLRLYGGGFQSIDMTVSGTSCVVCCFLLSAAISDSLLHSEVSYGSDPDFLMVDRKMFLYNTQLRNKGTLTVGYEYFTTLGTTYA